MPFYDIPSRYPTMIQIHPGKGFDFKNPNKDTRDLEEQVRSLLRGASPFLETVHFKNQTKNCLISITFANKEMVVVFTNPNDAEFDCNGDVV